MIPILAIHLPDYFYFVFTICGLVSACIVMFYAKHHPNPHFRPKKGAVATLTFFMIIASGGLSFMTASLLDADFDKDKIKAKLEAAEDRMKQGSGGGGDEGNGPTVPEPAGGGSALPEDVPDEIRGAIEG